MEEFEDKDDGARVWIDDHSWRTSFPPPNDFNDHESGWYGDADYSRQCTPEERELLDRLYPDAIVDQAEQRRTADEAVRDAYFAGLAEELNSSPSPAWGGEPFPEEEMVEG